MKLRLILFTECDRNCEGCCNQDWDIPNLPDAGINELEQYEEIMLTGGEPMLAPLLVHQVINNIREVSKAKVYVYTAKMVPIFELAAVLMHSDGITITLHEQEDVYSFLEFARYIDINALKIKNKSLRLNIFKGILLPSNIDNQWVIKQDIEWLKNCPLPEGETLKKYNQSF